MTVKLCRYAAGLSPPGALADAMRVVPAPVSVTLNGMGVTAHGSGWFNIVPAP